MRSRTRASALIALSAVPLVPLLLLTGCDVLTGNASASDPKGRPGRPAADSLSLPPPTPSPPHRTRPRSIPLDRVTPCQLLTPAQQRQLGYDRPPRAGLDTHFGSARTCALGDSVDAFDAQLAAVTSTGIEVWTDQTAQVDTEPVLVHGFPALVVRTPGVEDACNIEVDTGDGQFLDVLANDGGHRTPPPQQVYCQRARDLAEAAMTSLGAR